MSGNLPSQHRYRFADHVRGCVVDGQVILLDLRRGRYLGIGGPAMAAIASSIVDWPAAAMGCDSLGSSGSVQAWIDSLRDQGMLVPAASAPVIRPRIEEPLDSLCALDQAAGTGLQWRRLARMVHAALVSAVWLRRHSLAEIADRVSDLRAGAHLPVAGSDPVRLRAAVGGYLRTRPFVMTSHDACLRDSLTLVRYLAAEQLHARWVIGVRSRPFAAHSWVQVGHLVLNDLHETVRGYTPILVV